MQASFALRKERKLFSFGWAFCTVFVKTVKKCKMQVAEIRCVQVLTDLDESTPHLVNNASAVEERNRAVSQRSEFCLFCH